MNGTLPRGGVENRAQPLALQQAEDDGRGERVEEDGRRLEGKRAAFAFQWQLDEVDDDAVEDDGDDRFNGDAFRQFAPHVQRHRLGFQPQDEPLDAVQHFAGENGNQRKSGEPDEHAHARKPLITQQAQGDKDGGKRAAIKQVAGAEQVLQAALQIAQGGVVVHGKSFCVVFQ